MFNASSPQDIDLNTIEEPGTYTTNGSAPATAGWTNYPVNNTGYVQVDKFGGVTRQIYVSYNGVIFVRCKLTEWSEWEQIS